VRSNGTNGARNSRDVRQSPLFEARLAEVTAEYELSPLIVKGVSLHLAVDADHMPGSRHVRGTTWIHQTDDEHHPALWIYYTLESDLCELQWIEAANEEIPTKLK
jgi:hypothetical protein